MRPLDAPCFAPGDRRGHGRGGAIAEEACADEHARVVVDIKRCAAHLDADRKHAPAALRPEQRVRRAQVGQRRAAALADEIEQQRIGAQCQPLGDVARQSRAQVTGARADDERIDFAWRSARLVERMARGTCGQLGRLQRVAAMQDVRVELERLVE